MSTQFPLILVALGCGAGLVFAILRRPLFRVVVDLCGTEDRGRFWTLYTGIILVLSPMLAVSFAASSDAVAWRDPLFVERCTCWSILALMLALAVFGFTLWKPSNLLFEAKTRREAMAGPKSVLDEVA